jgi:Universal stress protein family
MRTLLAALDSSLAVGPVLATAQALAPLLDCEVEAVHLRVDGDRMARGAAEVAGIRLSSQRGPLVESLVLAGRSDAVVAMVIGARGTPGAAHPLGSTALAVATGLGKPIVVVPPEAAVGDIRRILVPIEGSPSAARPPRVIIEVAEAAEVEMIALHVYQEQALPTFMDQPLHWQEAWAHEFIRRYCHWHRGSLRLETRVGRAQDLVPMVADELDVDLVALAWSQGLGPGQAPIVRSVLERCHRPVMLVPIDDPSDPPESTVLTLASTVGMGHPAQR